jgi:hypothetical protein
MPVDNGALDATVSRLMLNFVPAEDQLDAVSEMARATRDGGTVAGYV